MNMYDESTHTLLDAAAVEANVQAGRGYPYPGQIETGRVPAHTEVMAGTSGLRRLVPERIQYESCLLYHAYTAQELAEKNAPTQLDRVEAQAAYTALMTGTLLEV